METDIGIGIAFWHFCNGGGKQECVVAFAELPCLYQILQTAAHIVVPVSFPLGKPPCKKY
jgi:hypothetical protein